MVPDTSQLETELDRYPQGDRIQAEMRRRNREGGGGGEKLLDGGSRDLGIAGDTETQDDAVIQEQREMIWK